MVWSVEKEQQQAEEEDYVRHAVGIALHRCAGFVGGRTKQASKFWGT